MEDPRSRLAKLTDDQLLRLKANIIGYGPKLPPDIETFCTDPYYLGNVVSIYPYWMAFLKRVFPTCITQDANMLGLVAGLGVGKSMISQVIALYILCRLQHLKNLDYFGITDLSKPIKFVFMHLSREQIYSEFIDPLNEKKKHSPYFNSGVPYKYKYEWVADTLRSHKGLGGNVIFYVMSEANFYSNQDKARKRIDIAWNRYLSRFIKGLGYLGMIILDSSPDSDSAVVDTYLAKFPFESILTRATQWDVKPWNFSKAKFEVYIGNGITPPYIISEDHPLEPDLDKDDVILVPETLRGTFEANIELALQDQAGISTKSTGIYVKYPDKFRLAFKIRMMHQKIFSLSQSDDSDSIYDHLRSAIEQLLPVERIIYIGLDAAFKNDRYGLTLGFYNGTQVEDESINLSKPTFSTPISVGIVRKKNEEVPLNKMLTFIIELSTHYEIGGVILDTFESKSLEQDLKRNKIRCWYESTDRSPVPTDYVKNAIYENRVESVDNPLLKGEWLKLKKYRNGKIDHPKTSSKDLVDSQVRCIYGIYRDIKHARKFSLAYRQYISKKMLAESGDPRSRLLNKAISSLIDEVEDDY